MSPLFATARKAPAYARAPGFAEVHGGGTRVRVVPAYGGRITEMEMGGRQWLWANDRLPHQPVPPAAEETPSYVETADSGGYDECFPTVAPCTLPGSAGRWSGVVLPDHGELWSQRPAIEVTTGGGAAGQSVTCTWTGRRLPYRFARTVTVTPSGEARMAYTVTNTGDAPVPFLWSAHPLFPLTADTRLVLPEGARMRAAAAHGIELGTLGAERRWPVAAASGKVADFSRPARVSRRYACKLFVDLPPGAPATIGIEERGARLEVTVDPREVPLVGLWINHRGWTGVRRGKAYSNVALEPCLGAPDSLADAFGAWDGAQRLAPGASRYWTLTWHGPAGA